MKKLILFGGCLLAGIAAHAQVTNVSFSGGFINGGLIPDGNFTGWSDVRTVDMAEFGDTNVITDLNVTLTLSGGFNGDIYGYLVHDSGFSVLLNRSGKANANVFGYGDAGYNITLDDSAPNGDIHIYQLTTVPLAGQPLTGDWAPDGRNTNPLTVNGLELQDSMLINFQGLTPNGNWTLFLDDLSVGGESTITGWGLQMNVAPVPEPSTFALVGLGVIGLLLFNRRRRA